MKTESALIYDSVSLKKVVSKLPASIRGHNLLIFKCAIETALKHKVSLEDLEHKKISVEDIEVESSYFFFQNMARSTGHSIGHKSSLALALCADKNLLLITSDECIAKIATSTEVACLYL